MAASIEPADIHAEHVGSLLRPPWLLTARAEYQAGTIGEAELRAAEDRATEENIAIQRSAGLRVFTDGEARRTNWMTGILESTGGMSPIDTPAVTWRREDGEVPPEEETDFVMTVATSKVFRKDHLTAVEAAYLATQVPGQFKVTMMSAAMGGDDLAARGQRGRLPRPGRPGPRPGGAAGRGDRRAGRAGHAVGAARLALLQPGVRRRVPRRDPEPARPGGHPGRVGRGRHRDRHRGKAAHPDVTVGMHICRGNNRSAYMAKGGYEPVAEQLFGTVPVDRFLLEYDTERAGGFEPLRFVRPGAMVVLGLVSSKTPVLESRDELRRRIDEAARYVPLENLALTPQCGFASTSAGNVLTPDEQRAKLALVVETAQQVWG